MDHTFAINESGQISQLPFKLVIDSYCSGPEPRLANMLADSVPQDLATPSEYLTAVDAVEPSFGQLLRSESSQLN